MKFNIFLLCLFSFFIFLGFYNISDKELVRPSAWTIILGFIDIGMILSGIEGFLKFLDKIEKWLQDLGKEEDEE